MSLLTAGPRRILLPAANSGLLLHQWPHMAPAMGCADTSPIQLMDQVIMDNSIETLNPEEFYTQLLQQQLSVKNSQLDQFTQEQLVRVAAQVPGTVISDGKIYDKLNREIDIRTMAPILNELIRSKYQPKSLANDAEVENSEPLAGNVLQEQGDAAADGQINALANKRIEDGSQELQQSSELTQEKSGGSEPKEQKNKYEAAQPNDQQGSEIGDIGEVVRAESEGIADQQGKNQTPGTEGQQIDIQDLASAAEK